MTGLESILKDIEQESAKATGAILDEAKAKASEIIAAARKEIKGEIDQIQRDSDRRVADMASNGEFAVRLHERQSLLSEKQTMIKEVLDTALQQAKDLPDGAYFDLLIKIASVNAHEGEGEILLNEKDAKRAPSDFESKVNAALSSGKKLTVSKANAEIQSGFLLRYGDIEENCSFEEILSAKRDELTDTVRQILFD